MGSSRRCTACKVLFESIKALDDHCTLTAHPLKPYRCLSCNRAYATPFDFQSHLGSAKHQRRAQISAQRSQANHDGATQPVLLTTNNVEDLAQTVCYRCKLTFENRELLFEHYRSSPFKLHPVCPICFQVFTKKKALKKHMAEYHSQSLVLPTPKSEDHQTQITIPAPPNPPATPVDTETTPQSELLEDDDDDFILVEKSSLLLRTPETSTPVTSIPQANAVLPNGLFKCPGCHTNFHPFSTFVIHIDSGACSSASVSQQINNEINAFAVQLFHNLSVTSG